MKFEDLKVYQIAIRLSGQIRTVAFGLPEFEQYRLRDQLLRATQSVTANIAEGFGRRRYQNDFIKFLTYSLGSCDEIQSHLNIIFNSKWIDPMQYEDLMKQHKNLSVRLLNFIQSIKRGSPYQSSVNSQSIRN
jgi:four helix bundle protein